MTIQDQKQLGNALWEMADQLRGAVNADDFRDYMLSFLFLRYLSDNYEAAAKKELEPDYPEAYPDILRTIYEDIRAYAPHNNLVYYLLRR